jgi:hypothetical protein
MKTSGHQEFCFSLYGGVVEQNEELSSEIRSEQPFVHVQKDVAKSSPEAANIHTTRLRNHICEQMVVLFMYIYTFATLYFEICKIKCGKCANPPVFSKKRQVCSSAKSTRHNFISMINELPEVTVLLGRTTADGHSSPCLGLASPEITMPQQRSRIAWQCEGDTNMVFFHQHSSYRRQKNVIHNIMVDGVGVT